MKVIEFTIPVARDHSIHIQEDKLPYFYEHLHRHHETQITWVLKGEGTLIAGNVMHPFNAGDVFIIGANQPHLFKSNAEYFEPGSEKRTHSINIFFNPKGFITTLLDFPEMLTIKKFIESSSYGMQANEISKVAITENITRVKKNSKGYMLAAFIELLQFMADLTDWKYLATESFEYTITDTEGLRMNEIYQYTIDHFTENITLEQIAEVVFLTPQSFCRYFKKHTLKTYTHFLNEIRINESCKRFMNNDFDSIAAVAYQTGFNNVVTFNRVFRSIMGTSPRGFIKEFNSKVDVISGHQLYK